MLIELTHHYESGNYCNNPMRFSACKVPSWRLLGHVADVVGVAIFLSDVQQVVGVAKFVSYMQVPLRGPTGGHLQGDPQGSSPHHLWPATKFHALSMVS